jgi:hypothetical protein
MQVSYQERNIKLGIHAEQVKDSGVDARACVNAPGEINVLIGRLYLQMIGNTILCQPTVTFVSPGSQAVGQDRQSATQPSTKTAHSCSAHSRLTLLLRQHTAPAKPTSRSGSRMPQPACLRTPACNTHFQHQYKHTWE